MPDRDWYTNHVQRNWRGVARRIEDKAPDERVADLCLRALGKTIREAGGVAGLEEFIGVVHDFGRGLLSLPQAFAQLRGICLRVGGSYLTQVAKAGAESTIGTLRRGNVRGDVGAEVRRRFVERALDAYLFAPARSRHVGQRFGTIDEAHAWRRQIICSMAPKIDKFAASLARHPDGVGLRAPRRQMPREATADLLYQLIT